MKQFIIEMENYANEHNVPIIEKDSIAFIMKYIKAHNVKNILEIGAAIGYSSILDCDLNLNIDKDSINNETPAKLTVEANDKEGNVFHFPGVKFGIYNDTVCIYAIQNTEKADMIFDIRSAGSNTITIDAKTLAAHYPEFRYDINENK